MIYMRKLECKIRQGCIPVGCVPSAAVAVCWWGVSASVHTGIHPPGPGPGHPPGLAWTPPGLGLDTPQAWPGHPLAWAWTSPLGLGLDTPVGLGLDTPRAWAWTTPRGQTPLSVDRMTDRCKNITFPQLRLRTVVNLSTKPIFAYTLPRRNLKFYAGLNA